MSHSSVTGVFLAWCDQGLGRNYDHVFIPLMHCFQVMYMSTIMQTQKLYFSHDISVHWLYLHSIM